MRVFAACLFFVFAPLLIQGQNASPLTVKLGGDIQFDSRSFFQKPQSISTFLFKDVRPSIRGSYGKLADFRLLANFAGSKLDMQEAYIIFMPGGNHRLQIGKMKTPFSLEVLQSNVYTTFIEGAYTYTLSPRRDLGICLHSSWFGSRLETTAGIFNGVVDGLSEDIDNATQKDFTFRVFAQPFVNDENSPLRKLGIGFGITAGAQRGQKAASSSADPSLITRLGQARTSAGTVFFKYNSATFANGNKIRFAPQASYYYKRLGVMSEFILSRGRVTNGPDDIIAEARAFDVTVSLLLTEDNASYTGVKPNNPVQAPGDGTGAWELALRFHRIAFDTKLFPVFADLTSASSAATISAGINWYLNEVFRFALNAERTSFTAGMPGSSLPTETVLLTRAQIIF